MTSLDSHPGDALHTSRIVRRQWLTEDTFTLALERPPDFQFRAGQRIQLFIGAKTRDYSLIPGNTHAELTLLMRSMESGVVSTHLSRCPLPTALNFSGPRGHFIYRPSPRPALFIATGTGIAPFAAMRREGVQGFVLLHGVRDVDELYYRDVMEPAAARYIPCLTGAMPSLPSDAFAGRVTKYLQRHWPAGVYDFYLAGRREMIAEVVDIVDQRFPASRVYAEIFF